MSWTLCIVLSVALICGTAVVAEVLNHIRNNKR